MDPIVFLGLIVLFVPIALVVIGAVQIHKLKGAVRVLSRRLSALESARERSEPAPIAPSFEPKPAPPRPVSRAIPPPIPSLPGPELVVPKQPTSPPPPL